MAVAAPGARDALEAIACPGATDCWAVGGSAAGGQAFIEHWTGGAWQLAPSPAVPGGQLDAISCASPSACWATGGTQAHSGVTGDLLEQWNGFQWAVATSVAGGLRPQQFSCPGRGYCLALGVRDGAAAAAAYTAGRWTAVAPPAPPAGAARGHPLAVRLRPPGHVPGGVRRKGPGHRRLERQDLDTGHLRHADVPGRPDLFRRQRAAGCSA